MKVFPFTTFLISSRSNHDNIRGVSFLNLFLGWALLWRLVAKITPKVSLFPRAKNKSYSVKMLDKISQIFNTQ